MMMMMMRLMMMMTTTMPLWLPYVIFTVVLLSLIVVSFARFHALRGAQYRNRQLADERSMGVNGAKNGFVSCNAINVGVDPVASPGFVARRGKAGN